MRVLSYLLLALLLSSCTQIVESGRDSASGTNTQSVDTIMTNGVIYTLDSEQPLGEAVAISNGVITAVGKVDEVEALAGPDTDMIDLAGNIVLPGFHDLHVHPLFGGMTELLCHIPQGSRIEEIQHVVRLCAERAETGTWITGGQWDASAIGRIPDRTIIDTVTSGLPALLNDTSGHSALANSRALEIAGVDRSTEDPPGGIIERDEHGEPTGVLRETAIDLVRKHVPPPSDAMIRKALGNALDKMLAAGITSYSEASLGFVAGGEREAALYAAFADEGRIKQRIRLCLTWTPGDQAIERLIAERGKYTRDRVSPDCVKMFLDGVPTDSHTAAMLEPYEGTIEGRDDEAARYGLLLIEQQTLNEAVTRFDKLGLTVKFHAAGDAAVRAGLDAIEAARKANGDSGLSHNPGHTTFIAREDIPRAKALGATLELSPYLWSPSPINDDITRAIGAERIKRVWPFRDIVEQGVLVVPGSDWAVVPSVNPWIAVESMVTRRPMGGGDRHFGAEQTIDVESAIEMFTVNAARHMRKADSLGRIRPGMLADLIVIDRDPYKTQKTELHKTTVLRTMINGETVYRRDADTGSAAH